MIYIQLDKYLTINIYYNQLYKFESIIIYKFNESGLKFKEETQQNLIESVN